MILTQQIPQDHWLNYFNDLSKHYRGWGITIEVLSQELGDQPLAEGLSFQGVSFDPVGSQAGEIFIEAGDTPRDFMIHRITAPASVQIAESQPGLEADLHILSEDGTTTLLRIRRLNALPPFLNPR